MLDQIPSLRFVVQGLEVNTVLRRELLFDLKRELPLLKVIVRALPWIGAVDCVQGIAAVTKDSVLSARFGPGASDQIFGAGDNAEAVPLEELRIFLLRNGRGERACPNRCQQVGQQVSSQCGCFVAQIDLVWIAEFVVAARQKE